MKVKIIVASIIIVAALIFGAISFVETNVEYADFQSAMTTHKKVHVKGEWLKEKESAFDPVKSQFVFYMKDDNNQEVKVIFEGASPNTSKVPEALSIWGRLKEGVFHPSKFLKNCPKRKKAAPK